MRHAKQSLLLIALLCFSFIVHAEGNCPPGYFPTTPQNAQGPQGCAPIPGYDQNNQQPQEPPMRWESRWDAIATDNDVGIAGVVVNSTGKSEAKNDALADCKARGGRDCKIQSWYRNGCAAMILGTTKFNISIKPVLNDAIKSGMKICKDTGDSDCHVYYSACSLPERIQ